MKEETRISLLAFNFLNFVFFFSLLTVRKAFLLLIYIEYKT